MEFNDLGNRPISGAAPSGKDVRYEPDFESLSKEISKLSDPSATTTIDWKNVVSLSCSILENQSKHLQVVCYLGYALIKTENMDGLAKGVHILKELLENFWDTMYPAKKRMKGRRSIVQWWENKVSDFLAGSDPVIWEKEKRDKLINDFNAVDEFFGEKMEDAPLLRPLINKIKSVVEEKFEEPDEPEGSEESEESEESEKPVETKKTVIQKPSETVKKSGKSKKPVAKANSADSDMDHATMLKQGLSLLGKSVSGLRKQNPFDPVPYRLNRIVAWSSISDPPTAVGGKTMLPPPEEHIIAAITGFYDSGKWQELADFCESKVKQYIFWLDLSRYVAESMEQLGHQTVSDVVAQETSLFIQLVPGIEKLSFSDGISFADSGTKEWLREFSNKKSPGTSKITSEQTDSVKQTILEQMGNAQKLIKEKKLDSALTLFFEPMSNSSSQRERFLWELGLCRLLINSKQIKIASFYIEDIITILEKYKLEIWEPDIAIDALALVLTGLRLQKKDQHKDLIESIINKISMLDPLKALEVL